MAVVLTANVLHANDAVTHDRATKLDRFRDPGLVCSEMGVAWAETDARCGRFIDPNLYEPSGVIRRGWKVHAE